MVKNTVTDIDGNVYRTIVIGQQEWMAENLKTTQFRNGTPILNILDMKAWEKNVSTAGWAYYDNDETNDAVYGKLYNWFAVSDSQGLCPEGWHIPSDNEWNMLIDYLGGAESAGCKMK